MGILFCFVLKKTRKFKFDYRARYFLTSVTVREREREIEGGGGGLTEAKNTTTNLILNFHYVIEIVTRYK